MSMKTGDDTRNEAIHLTAMNHNLVSEGWVFSCTTPLFTRKKLPGNSRVHVAYPGKQAVGFFSIGWARWKWWVWIASFCRKCVVFGSLLCIKQWKMDHFCDRLRWLLSWRGKLSTDQRSNKGVERPCSLLQHIIFIFLFHYMNTTNPS